MSPQKEILDQPRDTSPIYVLKIDERIVWQGKDLSRQLKKARKDNPHGKITITWTSDREFLVV